MDAAVLRQFGKPPRYEQFPEPVAGEGEIVVQVHAASLKPVDRQLANGAHYASPRELPCVCGTDGVGRLSNVCFLAELERLTVRWHNARFYLGPLLFRFPKA